MLDLVSAMRELERSIVVERTHSGLAAARKRGVRVGRRPARVNRDHLIELRNHAMSIGAIVTMLGLGFARVQRALVSIAAERAA